MHCNPFIIISQVSTAILFIVMKYKKIFEGWRKFINESEEEWEEKPADEFNMYFDNLASEALADKAAKKIIIKAFNRAIRILRRGSYQGLERAVKIKLGGSDLEIGGRKLDTVASLQTYTNDDDEVVHHVLAVNPENTSHYYRKFFQIIKKYWDGGVFSVDSKPEYELVTESVLELVVLLLLPTMYHEVLHAKSHETNGKSLGVDISKDANLDYYLQKGENAIRKLEVPVIRAAKSEAEKIIFKSLLPIFMHGDRRNKPEVISALMEILEYFDEQIKSNSDFFKTRDHIKKTAASAIKIAPLVFSRSDGKTTSKQRRADYEPTRNMPNLGDDDKWPGAAVPVID